MLLNIRSAFVIVITFLSASTYAQPLSTLKDGKYELFEGEKNLCRNFSISPKDLKAKRLSVGGFYDFSVSNSDFNIESDLDPACEFREQNRVEIRQDVNVLTRVNEEYCKGTLRSKTVSVVEIRSGEIQVVHQVDEAEVRCLWKK